MLIHDLSQSTPLLTSISEHLDAKPTPHPPTAIILVDGLAANISRLLGATYNELGSRVRFWGGGAGVSTFEQRPCLFTRDGVIENGAVIALTSLGVGLGVQHGWKVLKGPLVATRATGNTVHQLNWMAAVDVYSQHVADDLGHTLDVASLTSVTQSYPLGLHKEGEEVVVRDPVSVGSSGSLTCVGDVPENAVLAILKGDPKSLIHAAGQAARNACEGAPKEIVHCLIADCISRVMFLGDDFRSELEAIKHNLGDLPDGLEPVGVLTLGEISSRGDGYLEFFNKTCVVAVLHEQ